MSPAFRHLIIASELFAGRFETKAVRGKKPYNRSAHMYSRVQLDCKLLRGRVRLHCCTYANVFLWRLQKVVKNWRETKRKTFYWFLITAPHVTLWRCHLNLVTHTQCSLLTVQVLDHQFEHKTIEQIPRKRNQWTFPNRTDAKLFPMIKREGEKEEKNIAQAHKHWPQQNALIN